jgi:hypothetical protein
MMYKTQGHSIKLNSGYYNGPVHPRMVLMYTDGALTSSELCKLSKTGWELRPVAIIPPFTYMQLM